MAGAQRPGGVTRAGRHAAVAPGGDVPAAWRRPLLALGFLALLAGIAAGLARLGVGVPPAIAALIPWHGPLMVSGFFGTVIGLERAVAVGRRWAYAGPLATAAGGLALLAGRPDWGAALILAGSAGLTAATAALLRRQATVFGVVLLLGALAWVAGNVLWLAAPDMTRVVPWWAGFLVLTIAGERLELSRLAAPGRGAQRLFMAIVVGLVASLAAVTVYPGAGVLLALALAALTLWLLRHDVARRTVRTPGLTRYIALALLSGYVWLLAAALAGVAAGGLFAPAVFDATVHAVFLGFVFAMVFGHAPIILPAVSGLAVPWHPLFYGHLALLHGSLLLRWVGDLVGVAPLRQLGGVLNAAAVGLFLLVTAGAIIRARWHR